MNVLEFARPRPLFLEVHLSQTPLYVLMIYVFKCKCHRILTYSIFNFFHVLDIAFILLHIDAHKIKEMLLSS